MLLLEIVRLTRTVNSVSTSHLNQTFARESAQQVILIKTQSVFQNVCQDLETMVSVVVSNWELSLDVHSHTSTNKAHACLHAMPVHIQTLPAESVKHAVPIVSHACHLLSVPAAAQVST